MVKGVILVKSPKKLIAAKLNKINFVSQIKDITTEIQKINGVERTETMLEVQ